MKSRIDSYKIYIISIICLFYLFLSSSLVLSSEKPIVNEKEEYTKSIIDITGRTIKVPENVTSIVGAGPGALRLLCYMNAQNKIVGIEQSEKTWGPLGRPYIMASPNLLNLPTIGAGGPGSINSGPDPELILKVKPNVIFITYMKRGKAEEYQKRIKIPVIVLSYGELSTFDEKVYESLKIIGKVLNNEKRAQEVINFLQQAENDLNTRTKGIPENKRPNVYVGGIGFKGIHGIESTSCNYPPFNSVNARNVADELKKSGHLFVDKEQILKWDPDFIFIDEGGYKLVKSDLYNPLFQSLKAAKENHIYGILPYNFYTTNIGTAIADAYYIGKVLYPDKFKDIDIGKKADEIYKFLVGKPVYKEMEKAFGGFKVIK